ncbi:MAG TPA: hypothetical protein PLH02_02380 [Bacillota bacterium]|nr:hypothetical protein [Bacillota bacterium]HPQ61714.1 hypothetical protein [Bacillota bacterium]HRX45039.1 hypothetical protein [Acholeplasmataceae bacterium]
MKIKSIILSYTLTVFVVLGIGYIVFMSSSDNESFPFLWNLLLGIVASTVANVIQAVFLKIDISKREKNSQYNQIIESFIKEAYKVEKSWFIDEENIDQNDNPYDDYYQNYFFYSEKLRDNLNVLLDLVNYEKSSVPDEKEMAYIKKLYADRNIKEQEYYKKLLEESNQIIRKITERRFKYESAVGINDPDSANDINLTYSYQTEYGRINGYEDDKIIFKDCIKKINYVYKLIVEDLILIKKTFL